MIREGEGVRDGEITPENGKPHSKKKKCESRKTCRSTRAKKIERASAQEGKRT